MQNNLFDIITPNEIRLDSCVLNGEIEITGYDIVRRDRNRSGGGVAMYIRSNIPCINRMTPPNCLDFNIVKTMIAIILGNFLKANRFYSVLYQRPYLIDKNLSLILPGRGDFFMRSVKLR